MSADARFIDALLLAGSGPRGHGFERGSRLQTSVRIRHTYDMSSSSNSDVNELCSQSELQPAKQADLPNPADLDRSERLRDELRGVTTEHAIPPRLEDEGQSGG